MPLAGFSHRRSRMAKKRQSGATQLLHVHRRGFGLVVSVVVPSMLAVLPYARGRRFDSRSRLLNALHIMINKLLQLEQSERIRFTEIKLK
jgi:hypothetical protein